jgi:hypothetical protein
MRPIDFCHAMQSFEIVRPDDYWISLSERFREFTSELLIDFLEGWAS